MRKIFFVFLSVLILFTSTLFLYNQSAQAVPVASKVVSAAAKKVAKEVVKDQAVKQSMTILMNYEYKPKKDEKIQKPKESFTMVCLPQNKKSDGTCTKPMQVKKLNSADKKKLGQEAGKLLDKKIGHKGWKKFVDWFLPVWIIGAAITTVDLLMDGDLSSFFGDLAYEALVNLGFITNLGESPDKIDINKENFEGNIHESDEMSQEEQDLINNRFLGFNYEPIKLPKGIFYTHTIFHNGPQDHIIRYVLTFDSSSPYYFERSNGENYKLFSARGKELYLEFITTHMVQPKFPYLLRLNIIESYDSNYYSNRNVLLYKDFLVFDEKLYFDKYKFKGINDNQIEHLISLAEPFFSSLVVAPPTPMPQAKPDDIPVIKPGTTVTVPSPESVPVIDKNTGMQVRPTPDSTVDNPIWTTPDGTPVPEDDIEIGDVEIIETPDGDIVQKPESNPDIEEGIIPKPENPTNPENPTDPEAPDEEFPEGESCDARFKKPKFDKLGQEISSTFPFNIPFDLYQSFINLFAKMDDKKPSFDLDLNFLGDKKTINITVPEYFDRWQPFAHTLIIFIFDVGLLWAIYRFTGGSK